MHESKVTKDITIGQPPNDSIPEVFDEFGGLDNFFEKILGTDVEAGGWSNLYCRKAQVNPMSTTEKTTEKKYYVRPDKFKNQFTRMTSDNSYCFTGKTRKKSFCSTIPHHKNVFGSRVNKSGMAETKLASSRPNSCQNKFRRDSFFFKKQPNIAGMQNLNSPQNTERTNLYETPQESSPSPTKRIRINKRNVSPQVRHTSKPNSVKAPLTKSFLFNLDDLSPKNKTKVQKASSKTNTNNSPSCRNFSKENLSPVNRVTENLIKKYKIRAQPVGTSQLSSDTTPQPKANLDSKSAQRNALKPAQQAGKLRAESKKSTLKIPPLNSNLANMAKDSQSWIKPSKTKGSQSRVGSVSYTPSLKAKLMANFK